MVMVLTVSPALATIYGKSCILGVPVIHGIASDEIGHGCFSGRPELILRSFGWLEHDIAVTIGVQLTSSNACGLDVITTLLIDLRNVPDRIRPPFLH